MLISFSGRKYAGKDSAAEALITRHGFKRIGLADKLKEICSEVFDIPLVDMHDPDKKELLFETPVIVESDHIEDLIDILEGDGFAVSDEATKKLYKFVDLPMKSIRHLLQFFGSDVCRNCVADDMWLVYFSKQVADRTENIVVTDARFANERTFFKNLGATLVLVTRPSQGDGDSHISENQLGTEEDYDVILSNDSTKTSLQAGISMWYTVKHEKT